MISLVVNGQSLCIFLHFSPLKYLEHSRNPSLLHENGSVAMIDLCLCSEAPQLPILSNFSPVCVGVCEWKRGVRACVSRAICVGTLRSILPATRTSLGCQGKQWDASNDACVCSTFHCWPWDVTSSDCVNVHLWVLWFDWIIPL